MKIRRAVGPATMIGILTVAAATSHPHLSKRVEARVGQVWVKVSFQSSPASETSTDLLEVGSFNVGGRLELDGDLTVGDLTLKAGPYMLGAVKDGPDAWTMAVSPRYEGADHSEIIHLESSFNDQQPPAAQHDFDLQLGSGDSAGRVLLIWRFGTLSLIAPLS